MIRYRIDIEFWFMDGDTQSQPISGNRLTLFSRNVILGRDLIQALPAKAL